MLAQVPNLASWYLCDVIRRNYGKDGTPAVWPEIAEALGLAHPLPQALREKLHGIVAERCRRLGLPVPPERLVSLFQLHAGVADPQLHHLIDAFLAQEEASGAPPAEDGFRLNLWEDQALDYLHPTVIVLRMPILWDATAWHASLYARCRQGDVPVGDAVAERFAEVLKARQGERRSGRSGEQARPEPRLALDGIDLALRLPEGPERVRLSCDGGEALRLRGGRLWPLPRPLPRRIDWRLGERGGSLSVLPSEGSVLVADLDGGASPCHVHDRAELTMGRVAVFAREPFQAMAGGEKFVAEQLEDGLHLAVVGLGPQWLDLRLGGRAVALRQKLHRRLALRDGVIGTGAEGPLRDPTARLEVSTGIAEAAERWLRVELEGVGSGAARVATDVFGNAELPVGELLATAGLPVAGAPAALRVELMRPGDPGQPGGMVGSGLRVRAFLWAGWQGRSGNALDSDRAPGNLVLASCDGIALDDRDHPCIAPKREGQAASLAFGIEGRTQVFRLAPGELALSHLLPDGECRPLARGTRVVLTPVARGGAIRVQCQDAAASLEVCGVRRPRPFHAGSTCTIPLRGIGQGWLRLVRPDGRSVDLVEIVSAFSFETVAMERRFGGVSARLRIASQPDAVRVTLEGEDGGAAVGEVHFGPDAYLIRPVAWLSGERRPDGEIRLRLDPATLGPGLWVGTLSVRDCGGWHPLTAPRGDVVSVAAEGGPLPDDLRLTARLGRVLGWLDLCHAPQSWHEGGVGAALTRRRDQLAAVMAGSRGGRARLLGLAASEDWRGGGGTWMPPMHLLDACPDLFESPASAFHDAGPALSAVHRMDALRLREMGELDPTALLAFRNAARASRTGERLQGFDAARFFANLADPQVDHDPFAGRQWGGRPLLGPGHWRAAHERLEERIEETGFFGEDPDGMNGQRSERLLRTCPVGKGREIGAPPVPPPLEGDRAELHARLSAALLAYARAARIGRTAAWEGATAGRAEILPAQARGAMGDLLRLAPELFAFHLLVAELEGRNA